MNHKPIFVQPLSEDEDVDDRMPGACPHYASTDHEGCCTLTDSICRGKSGTCDDRRRSSCPRGDERICDDYDTCKCRECSHPTECLTTSCGETCACRPDETEPFPT